MRPDAVRSSVGWWAVRIQASWSAHSAAQAAAWSPAWSLVWWLYRTPLRVLWAGPEAVLVFFVVSGFVLTLPLARSGRFEWLVHYARRALRPYLPVFGIGMVLALNVDRFRALATRSLDRPGRVALAGLTAVVLLVSLSLPPAGGAGVWATATAFLSLTGVGLVVVTPCWSGRRRRGRGWGLPFSPPVRRCCSPRRSAGRSSAPQIGSPAAWAPSSATGFRCADPYGRHGDTDQVAVDRHVV